MAVETFKRIGAQPPLGHVARGSVEAVNLVTSDEKFVAEAEALEDSSEIGELCQDTFDLGVFIRKQATSSAELRSFDERVNRFVDDVTRVTHGAVLSLSEEVTRITDPDHGLLNEAVEQQLRSLAVAIDSAFDEKDKTSALNRLEQAVRTAATDANEQSTRSLRDLLSVSTDNGPLAELRATIVREVAAPFAGLSDSLAKVDKLLTVESARRDEHSKGTQQGGEFEDALSKELVKLCQVTNDVVTHTGNQLGASGKTGDHVIEIRANMGGDIRIVLECKKRSAPMSIVKIREELDAAAKNRDAVVAVMVLSSEDIAPNRVPLQKLADHRYVVVYDDKTRDALALRLAFHEARSDAVATLVTSADPVGLDVGALVSKLAEARTALRHLKQIQLGVTKVRAALDAVEGHSVSMQSELVARLDECDRLIESGAQA